MTLAANAVLLNFFLVAGFFLDGMAAAAEQIIGRSIVRATAPLPARCKAYLHLGLVMAGLVASSCWLWRYDYFTSFQAEDVHVEAMKYLPWAALKGLRLLASTWMASIWRNLVARYANMMFLSLIFFLAVLYAASRDGYTGFGLPINLFCRCGALASGDPAAPLSHGIRALI
ncbi:Multi antimicrobial extrusion protein MatE [Brucella melitensis]|nr:Multi antimicrobial extrusion protein MatE [Brucella melitensis]